MKAILTKENSKPIWKEFWLPSAILAFLSALMIPVGKSLKQYTDFRLFAEAPGSCALQVLGYGILLFAALLVVFGLIVLLEKRGNTQSPGRISQFFLHHRFLHWGILFLIIGGIFVFFYPGTVMGDTVAQIRESFGIGATYANMPIQYLYEDSRLTAMHPVVSTLFVKFCMLLGHYLLGSYNMGLCLVVLFQIALITYGISRMCYVLALVQVRGGIILGYLIYLFINPMTVNYVYLLTKDLIFIGFFLLFFVEIFLLMTRRAGKRDYVLLAVSSVGSAAFRGEGLYFILVSLGCAVIYLWITAAASDRPWHKKQQKSGFQNPNSRSKKQNAAAAGIAAGLFLLHLLFVQVGYPLLKVTPGAKSFQATIPIQQVSRFWLEKQEELSEEELHSIAKVMNLEQLQEEFNPRNADPAKKCFDINAAPADFSAFMKTWGSVLGKDPGLAFTAWLNTKYEFFSLTEGRFGIYRLSTSRNRMSKLNDTVSARGPDLQIHYPAVFSSIRSFADSVMLHYSDIPVLNLLAIPAVYIISFLAVLIFFLRRRAAAGILLLIPLGLVLIITNLLSATNGGYSRYLLPLVMLLPFVMLAGMKKNCINGFRMLK